jgi:regulatory protein
MFDPERIWAKALSYCSYQERCSKEVREKLNQWGLDPGLIEEFITRLSSENYLNDERFAIAYVGGKFRIKKWGPLKIRLELMKRNINEHAIKLALREIDGRTCFQLLKKNLEDHGKKISERNPAKRKQLLGRYAISKGFEAEMVWDLLTKKSPE